MSTTVARSDVSALRTERSRTYRLVDGTYEQEIAPVALNYRDSAGAWQPIDNTLRRRADGGFENVANDFRVRIPERASGEVGVATDDASLTFELLGASGTVARSDGDEARFANARPDVTVSYEAIGRSLKETLTLAAATAPSAYDFAVEAPGLQPALSKRGAIEFRDADGVVQLAFAVPWMRDAAGVVSRALRYEIRKTAGRDVIALVLDRAWLNDARRAFPVVVDPTVTEDPEGMCELVSGADADEDFCAEAMPLGVGRWEGKVHRAAIALELPADVAEIGRIVTGAELRFELDEQYWAGPSQLDLHALTQAMNPGATWSSAGPGRAWRTPGGDLAAQREGRVALSAANIGGSVSIGVPRLVQALTDSSEANNGVVIKAVDESVEHIDVLEDFLLKVTYRHRTGLDDLAYAFDHWDLADGTRVDVNSANQNLIVSTDDFGLEGFDDQLAVDRVYNSQNDVTGQGVFGINWRGDIGTVRLRRNAVDDSYALDGPSGLDALFVKELDGRHRRLQGEPQTLTVDGGGLTVTDDLTGETWTFDAASPHRLVRRAYPSEAGVEAVYDLSGRLSLLRDAAGNSATFTYDGSGRMTSVRDQAGAVRRYAYDGAGNLVRFTNPAGQDTTYGIDRSGRLASIVVPGGSGMTFTYYGTSRYLATVTPFDAARVLGPTTTYYGDEDGVEIETTGQKDVYRYGDRRLFNPRTLVGPSPPSLTLSGALYDARETTLPVGEIALSYSATDLSGIARVEIVVDGLGEAEAVPECTGACGPTFAGDWTLDTDDYVGGTYVVRVVATDANGDRHERSFSFRVAETASDSDGVMPGDEVTDPEVEAPMSNAPCETLFGRGSALCTTEGSDPEDDGTSSIATMAVDPSRHRVVYGIAQDFAGTDWIDSRFNVELGVRRYRRILPFNLMATTDGRPFRADPASETWATARRRLKFSDEVDAFAAQYARIYTPDPGSGRAAGELMVSFASPYCEPAFPLSCRRDRRGDALPSWDLPLRERYRRNIRSFLETFSNVNVISAWNEPNHPEQAPHTPRAGEAALSAQRGGAPRAAYYTLWASQVCSNWARSKGRGTCTVVAADMFQDKYGPKASFVKYLRDYRRAVTTLFGRASMPLPKVWGFHPYSDVKEDRRSAREVTGADLFARNLPPGQRSIWFTEVGSRVDTGDNGGKRRNSLPAQALEVEHLMSRMIHRRSAIRRLYYYALCAPIVDAPVYTARFDSGLIGGGLDRLPYGTCVENRNPPADYQAERPAYAVAKRYMR